MLRPRMACSRWLVSVGIISPARLFMLRFILTGKNWPCQVSTCEETINLDLADMLTALGK